jgi:hypothetical protein
LARPQQGHHRHCGEGGNQPVLQEAWNHPCNLVIKILNYKELG